MPVRRSHTPKSFPAVDNTFQVNLLIAHLTQFVATFSDVIKQTQHNWKTIVIAIIIALKKIDSTGTIESMVKSYYFLYEIDSHQELLNWIAFQKKYRYQIHAVNWIGYP